MRARTFRRRGRFYRRRRSRWRLNVALVVISVALVGFVVFDVRQLAGPPASGLADDAAMRRAATAPMSARSLAAELGPGRPTLGSTPPAPIAAALSPPARMLAPQQACDVIRARTQHVGEVVSFRGEFVSDHLGVATIRPVGCKERAGIDVIRPAALRRLHQADPVPWSSPSRHLMAEFTARLVRSGARTADVGGVRLSVSTVRDLSVIEPTPSPRSLARVVMRSPTPTGGCKACSDEVPF